MTEPNQYEARMVCQHLYLSLRCSRYDHRHCGACIKPMPEGTIIVPSYKSCETCRHEAQCDADHYAERTGKECQNYNGWEPKK